MKIKLSYFLAKRRVSLEKYCKLSKINTYEQLKGILSDSGVKCPPLEDLNLPMSYYPISYEEKPKVEDITKAENEFSVDEDNLKDSEGLPHLRPNTPDTHDRKIEPKKIEPKIESQRVRKGKQRQTGKK